MPKKDIESMIVAWSRSERPKQRVQKRAGVSWVLPNAAAQIPVVKRRTPTASLRYYLPTAAGRSKEREDKAEEVRAVWVVDETRKPCVEATKEIRETMAVCEIIRFEGEEAECSVKVGGYDLPSVSIPSRVLKAKMLTVGKRFIWTIRDASYISPADIDPDVGSDSRPQLTDEQQQRLEELHRASLKRRAEGVDWPEFTGPGE